MARIVEQLGGQLRVDSKLDQGSKFSFLIPFSLNKEDSASSASRSGSSVSSSRPSNRLSSDESASHKIEDLFDAISSDHMQTPGTPSRQVPARVARRSRRSKNSVGEAGEFQVEGSKYPIRSIKMDESKLDKKRTATKGISSAATAFVAQAKAPNPNFALNAPPSKAAPPTEDNVPGPSSLGISSVPLPSDPAVMRILVVEVRLFLVSSLHDLTGLQDETINRTILCKRLTMDGHQVVGTTNGQEGVDTIQQDREFDCVLMDIQ